MFLDLTTDSECRLSWKWGSTCRLESPLLDLVLKYNNSFNDDDDDDDQSHLEEPFCGRWPFPFVFVEPQKMSGMINLEGTRFSRSLDAFTVTLSEAALSASFGGWKNPLLLSHPPHPDIYPVLKTLNNKLNGVAGSLDCLDGEFVIWRGQMDSIHLRSHFRSET